MGGNGGVGGNGGGGGNLTGGGGGGAGGWGAVITGSGGTLVTNATGGNGGAGGNGLGASASGASAGSGGVGLAVTGSNASLTVNGTVTGGNGGTGGNASGFAAGGSNGGRGGAGGAGLIADSVTLILNAGRSITGGTGGAGGNGPVGGANGPGGAGGAGIRGSNLTITTSGTIAGGAGGAGGTAGAAGNAITFTGGTNSLTLNTGFVMTGNIGVTGSLGFVQPTDATLANSMTGAGSVSKSGAGILTLSGASTYSGGTTVNSGVIDVQNSSALGTGAVTVNTGAQLQIGNVGISNAVTINGTGLANDGALRNTFGNTTLFGLVTLGSDSSIVAAGNTLFILGGINTNGHMLTLVGSAFPNVQSEISGSGGVILDGTTFNFGANNTYTGPTIIQRGDLLVSTGDGIPDGSAVTINALGFLRLNGSETIASLAGSGTVVSQSASVLTVGANNLSTTFSGSIQENLGVGSLVKIGTGTLNLTGVSTYTGATTVDGGTLAVNGSVATSSGVTVNTGGTLAGAGTVPSVVINAGGTLSPGNSPGTLTVNGNLTLNAGAITIVQVQASVIDRVNVSGTASLNGTLQLQALSGPYTFGTPYTFLQAATRIGTFATIQTTGSFGVGVLPTVTYTDTLAQLTLISTSLVPSVQSNATANQLAVAGALDNAVINLGGNANPFFPLYNSSAAGILIGLNQLSGQAHTAAGPIGSLAAGQFLSVLTGGFGGARVSGDTTSATAYASTRSNANGASRAIEAAAKLAPGAPLSSEARRYNVWGAITGGGGPITGTGAAGSVRRTETNYGVATGVDVALQPGLTAGFALSGGQATARLADGLGALGANIFQAALYGRAETGGLKLGAAMAYSYLDLDSNRSVPVLGLANLNARYGANGFSGRIEAAYDALSRNGLSLSPVAAVQGSIFRVGGFTETAGLGAVQAAGLTAPARDQSSLRGELGLQADARTSVANLPAEAFVRAAWGVYGLRESSLTAGFAGLPGSTFTVTGAQNDASTALLSAGLDLKLAANLVLTGRFDGEYGARTARTQGTVRLKLAF